jgi:hypothetical protein
VPPAPTAAEIVLTAADVRVVRGDWKKVASATSPGGRAMASSDRGRSALTAPRPAPADFFEAVFRPAANVPYRVWLRLRGRSTNSDSVWVQFSGAVAQTGAPLWRAGTQAGLAVVQSPCGGCQPAGWGWEDNGWWVEASSIVRFPSSAPQAVRIQMREDGVAVDHIVLSPLRYMTKAPGPRTNDRTILQRTAARLTADDVVLGARDAVRRAGNWSLVNNRTAAGQLALASANRGWSAVRAPLKTPRDAVDFTFAAIAGVRYRVWLRLAAGRNNKANDSLWLQYLGAIDSGRRPIYAIGTSQGVAVTLQECSSCGLSGWGWADGSWWVARPGTVVFGVTGIQRLRIQTREDGARFDQIVLSPGRYLMTAPGLRHDDSTIIQLDGTRGRP